MNRHYAVTDLHGMRNLWEQISSYCDDTDTIYFLGDACDRGDHGIFLIRCLLTDKRVKYIRGNHEEMLVEAFDTLNPLCILSNGGKQTYEDFINLDYNIQENIARRLRNLPNQLEYINTKGQRIILNHSGSIPDEYESWELILFRKGENLYTWDRRHFHRPWCGDDNTFIIHGHTPVPYVITTLDPTGIIYGKNIEADEILYYSNGHKIDLDIASFATNKIALFDLDTLTVEKYFTIKGD